jgi:nucleoid DNA-binding protein
MATITKKELVVKISQAQGIHPNEVRNVIQAFLDEMTDCLSKGDRLEFRDFGVFEIVERKQKNRPQSEKCSGSNRHSSTSGSQIYTGQKNEKSDRETACSNKGYSITY